MRLAIDHLTELDIADANRKILKSFFGVLKATDAAATS
jgi:hypothetical protein